MVPTGSPRDGGDRRSVLQGERVRASVDVKPTVVVRDLPTVICLIVPTRQKLRWCRYISAYNE